jgi:L-rhamnose mutarotase
MRYIGTDFEGDMQSIAEDENTKRWWKVTPTITVPE